MASITWETISRWPESELANVEIAIANLLCAGGLPETRVLDIHGHRRTLDQWAARVRDDTHRLGYLFQRQPEAYQNSEAHFRMMILVTVLQRDLGVHYSPRFNDMPDSEFFARPKHLFIHGVIEGREGTCSSLPPTFAAVGRLLGYPLKLVTAFRHVFLRWDAPSGERFNIECTSQGLVCHSDEHYQQWPNPLSAEQVRRYGALQSLTPRQELAVFIANRAHVCMEHGALWEGTLAYVHACELDPGNWGLSETLTDAMNRWDRKLNTMMMIGFPSMTVIPPPRGFPNVPLDLERGICHLMAKDKLLNDAALQEKWWQPLRRDPGNPPSGLPAHITACYPQKKGGSLDFYFASRRRDGYDPKNLQPA